MNQKSVDYCFRSAGDRTRCARLRASRFHRRMGAALSRGCSPSGFPGPELGDYLELPINDAARLRADSYDCRSHLCGAGISMPAAWRGLRDARTRQHPSLERNRSGNQRLIAFHLHFLAWDSERTIWMDGTAAPRRTSAAHLAGIFDRRVGRQHVDHHHHSPERKLHSPEWRPAQRQGDAHRTLDAPCATG